MATLNVELTDEEIAYIYSDAMSQYEVLTEDKLHDLYDRDKEEQMLFFRDLKEKMENRLRRSELKHTCAYCNQRIDHLNSRGMLPGYITVEFKLPARKLYYHTECYKSMIDKEGT